MQVEKEICMKFPTILRDKLLKKEIEFPNTTLFEYEPIRAYRAVEREKDDYTAVNLNDFKSYYELKKIPKGKRPRGNQQMKDLKKDPHYYGASSFLKLESVRLVMKFPNPHKKIARGFIYCEGGPQDTNEGNGHICWWMYEGADISGFELIGEEDNE